MTIKEALIITAIILVGLIGFCQSDEALDRCKALNGGTCQHD